MANKEESVIINKLLDKINEMKNDLADSRAEVKKLKLSNESQNMLKENCNMLEEIVEKKKENKLLQSANALIAEQKSELHKYRMIDSELLPDPDYDYSEDTRWTKTIAIFDKLWHYNDEGPDGCGECEMYQKILFNAFHKIEQYSNRTLEEFTSAERYKGKAITRKMYERELNEVDTWYQEAEKASDRYLELDELHIVRLIWRRTVRSIKKNLRVLRNIHKYRIRIMRK